MSFQKFKMPGGRKPPRVDECKCPCHKAPLAVMHPVPCCEPCPVCGGRVPPAHLLAHLARHGVASPPRGERGPLKEPE